MSRKTGTKEVKTYIKSPVDCPYRMSVSAKEDMFDSHVCKIQFRKDTLLICDEHFGGGYRFPDDCPLQWVEEK